MSRVEPRVGDPASTRSSLLPRVPRGADLYALLLGIGAAVAAAAIYRAALHQGLSSDFPPDVEFTVRGITKGVFPGNFLLEILVALVGLFHTDTPTLNISLFLVLGLATGAKVWLSARFVISEDARASGERASGVALGGILIVTGLCALTFCLPAQNIYLGGIPANVWHNPSTILVMPFAIGLFWSSLLYLREGRVMWLWVALALGAFNIAAKPSFVLCFLPVFPCAALLRYGIGRELLRAVLLVLGITCMLGLQYVYVYVIDPAGSTLTSSSGVIVSPLTVWETYTSEIPRAILASYAFPLVAFVLGGRVVWGSRAVQHAAALAAVGLIEYALLAEQGARLAEGNLTWQAIVTQYVLFLALIAALVPWFRRRPWGLRQAIIVVAFAAHVWAGVHFLQHWFSAKTYL
jgi:hypothetical protein